ncbi:hypothetical protein J6590_063721 [Homalodisca vitripennis]|nr:hypothetical protein J6590_063721 [Homalodisca vitripennis]
MDGNKREHLSSPVGEQSATDKSILRWKVLEREDRSSVTLRFFSWPPLFLRCSAPAPEGHPPPSTLYLTVPADGPVALSSRSSLCPPPPRTPA